MHWKDRGFDTIKRCLRGSQDCQPFAYEFFQRYQQEAKPELVAVSKLLETRLRSGYLVCLRQRNISPIAQSSFLIPAAIAWGFESFKK